MATSPTAAVIIIGNEILSGRTADVNLNAIARRLMDVGVQLKEARFVRDEKDAIITTVNALRVGHDYVFTTGGIGPTHDDITVESVAEAFSVPVSSNAKVADMLKRTRGSKFNNATLKMALYPEGAQLIPTPEPAPPGFCMGNVYVLAGVPSIMQDMLEGVIPLLDQGAEIHSESVDVLLGESQISEPLAEVQTHFQDVEIGSYPFRAGEKYGTSLVVRGVSRKSVDSAFAHVKSFLEKMNAPVRG